jgi:hypothetical protein
MIAIEDITKRRAYIVFETLKEELMEGGGTDLQAEAFRFSFLILRGSSVFLSTFGIGNLFLHYDSISEIYFLLRFDLPGAIGLSDEEEQLILVHNKAVIDLEKNLSNSLSF